MKKLIWFTFAAVVIVVIGCTGIIKRETRHYEDELVEDHMNRYEGSKTNSEAYVDKALLDKYNRWKWTIPHSGGIAFLTWLLTFVRGRRKELQTHFTSRVEALENGGNHDTEKG